MRGEIPLRLRGGFENGHQGASVDLEVLRQAGFKIDSRCLRDSIEVVHLRETSQGVRVWCDDFWPIGKTQDMDASLLYI